MAHILSTLLGKLQFLTSWVLFLELKPLLPSDNIVVQKKLPLYVEVQKKPKICASEMLLIIHKCTQKLYSDNYGKHSRSKLNQKGQ